MIITDWHITILSETYTSFAGPARLLISSCTSRTYPPTYSHIHSRAAMLHWFASLFGFEPIRLPPPRVLSVQRSPLELGVDQLTWPEGPQTRKEVRGSELAGWDQTNWAWRSIRLVSHPGSLYPQIDQAECRCCLGVLQCKACGDLVRPNTKSREMSTQLARGCPKSDCGDVLEWRRCEARIHRFVIKEDGVEYSNWEHIGYHDSHPRPPTGRKPFACLDGPYSINTNTQLSGEKIATTAATSFVSVRAISPEVTVADAPVLPMGTSGAAMDVLPEPAVMAEERMGTVVWSDE